MSTTDHPTAPARAAHAEVPPPQYWLRWGEPEIETPEQPAPSVMPASIIPAPAGASNSNADAIDEPPYRVLIVEDDRSQALFAQSVLHGAGMQAIVQTDVEGVQEAINAHKPDLILMDLHMPNLDGMRLTSLIRQQPQHQLLPIVFLTGDIDPERQFEVLDSGADDFLTKPIRPRHLVAAVSNRIRRARQQSQHLMGATPVLTNPETGLITRHFVMQALGTALSDGSVGGLLFIEIGSALGLRERYGYAMFEKLMRQAGRRLADAFRPHVMSRLGDNTFLMLAPGVEAERLPALAQDIRRELSVHPFPIRDDESIHLRCVVGHSPFLPEFADAGTALEAVERTALQARLLQDGAAAYQSQKQAINQEHLALLDGHLELAYQPIVAVAGNNLAQYQVLLRIRRNDGVLLSAGQVIPAAESAGRIADLDQQVMEHALGLLNLYQHAHPPMRLFVSQSLRTLSRAEYADWLAQSLRSRGVDGQALVIDVRLPDALIHAVSLQRFCEHMIPTGVQFCLSQFEPSPEAFALLKQLPLSFVRTAARYASAHTQQKLRDELRSVIEAGHAANLQIIGQQIEDAQAAAAMWMGGVDFIQGNMVQSVGNELTFDFHNAVL